jgi:hypothetical protein
MSALIRAHDWSVTPLGEVTAWPHTLRTVVEIMLDSRYPMFVWWGDAHVNLYNDAYAPVLGARHPRALGLSAHDVWSDIWDVVGPQADLVLARGESTRNERL